MAGLYTLSPSLQAALLAAGEDGATLGEIKTLIVILGLVLLMAFCLGVLLGHVWAMHEITPWIDHLERENRKQASVIAYYGIKDGELIEDERAN